MSDDLDMLFKPLVLVTGFGPFAGHPVNASWEAVKHMNKEELEQKYNIELVLLELSVIYENIDEFLPALWETHAPKLVIHAGVSGIAKCFTLEAQAHKKGYKRFDYYNKCPPDHVCPADGAIRIQTKLNVERICKEFNNAFSTEEEISASPSWDAGRYLCEYIYYRSLSIDNTRTLFVHVPSMDVYSTEKTTRGLEKILDLALQQVKETEMKTNELAGRLEETSLESNEC